MMRAIYRGAWLGVALLLLCILTGCATSQAERDDDWPRWSDTVDWTEDADPCGDLPPLLGDDC